MDPAKVRKLYPHLSDQQLEIAAHNLDQFAVLIAEMWADQEIAKNTESFDRGLAAPYDQGKVDSPNK